MNENLKDFLAERLEADQHTAEAAGYDKLDTVVNLLSVAAADRDVPGSVQEALRHVAREMIGARGCVGGFWAREVAEVLAPDARATGA